jgi:hypothetical protein
MHLRHILEPNHMHQRHPQTHNMKTEEDMKTEEEMKTEADDGFVKPMPPSSTPGQPNAPH